MEQVENQTQEKVSVTPETQEVSIAPEVQEKPATDDSVDEKGVPYKNRYEETKRKLEKLELQSQQKVIQQNDEQYWSEREQKTGMDRQTLKVIDATAQEQASLVLNMERSADKIVHDTLNLIEINTPLLKKYRNAIEERLCSFPANARSDRNLIETIAYAELGKNSQEILEKPISTPKSVKSPLLDSAPTSSNNRQITLTEEEKQFAFDKGLHDKGYTESEVRTMYNKWQKSQKIKNGG